MTADLITTIPCHARTVRGLDHPVVFVRDGHVFANSEDVATYFGKQHGHVMRDIRALISNNNSCASNFGFTSRSVPMPAGGTREVATCNMDRDGFTLLAMGFTGKRALTWKLKYIEAFNAMERQLSEPKAADRKSPPSIISGYQYAIDQIDAGMDLVNTVTLALDTKSSLCARDVLSIRHTLELALGYLEPVRAHVNNDI